MTFAEYNTDDNYDNKNGFESSLEELVKLGLAEGKTSDEIKSSLSPKWQKSKKIGEFDNYVSKYSTPKAEETKPTEEKVVEKVVTETAPQTTENKQKSKAANKQNEDSLTQEQIDTMKICLNESITAIDGTFKPYNGTEVIISLGQTGMIGKGKRGPEVIDAMKEHGAVYFGAIGGCGALLSKCIKKAEVIAYDDLGAEAIRRLEVEDFPAIVIIDSEGNNLYEMGRKAYLAQL